MTRLKVILVSFAPKHSSSLNRIADCSGGNFDLEVYDSETDKVEETIGRRIFSTKFPRLIFALLRSNANVMWAWGLDACFIVTLVALVKPRTKLIWDITDLNPRVLDKSWKASLLRKFEWLLLKRTNLLLLTSEAFFDNYYRGHINRDSVKIIENFLPGTAASVALRTPPLKPCVIVYTGIFRSIKVLEVLRKVANIMSGEVVFHLHGYPDRTISTVIFEELVSGSPWIHFHGRFKPDELQEIYAKTHLNWAFVDQDANDNERWLLSNRIYNAVAFGKPALVNSNTYLGEVVSDRFIGIACNFTPNEIAATIRSLIANDGIFYHRLIELMPPPQSAYLKSHYRNVIENLITNPVQT